MSEEKQEVVVWYDGKERDVHEIRLVAERVKFAKHNMVSSSDLLVCVMAAGKD